MRLKSKVAQTSHWFHRSELEDGSNYLGWKGLFEFIVSADGRVVECLKSKAVSQESFGTYLLGQVLSFALLAQNIEPLHGTAVSFRGKAVLFLGDCGYGKSTLGAAFLSHGFPIITDDLVVLRSSKEKYWIQPGLPRVKLFEKSLDSLLPGRKSIRMIHGTNKRLIPLTEKESLREESELHAIYVLSSPQEVSRKKSISIKKMAPAPAFLALIQNTFNPVIGDRYRLENQFKFCNNLVKSIQLFNLYYPRQLKLISNVCEEVLNHFQSRELVGQTTT